jgi:hypothetical protein
MANLGTDLATLLGLAIGAAARRTAISAGAFVMVSLLVATAYVAIVTALAILLGRWLGIIAALGAVAVAALMMAVVVALIVRSANRAARQKAAAEANLRRLAIAAAVSLLPGQMVRSPLAILAAVGVGFGLGRLLYRRPEDET